MRTAPCSVPIRWRGSGPGQEHKNLSKPEKLHHRPLAAGRTACLRREAVGWFYPIQGGRKNCGPLWLQVKSLAQSSENVTRSSKKNGSERLFPIVQPVSSKLGGKIVPKSAASVRSVKSASS